MRAFLALRLRSHAATWAASLGWARVIPRRQGLGLVVLGLAASVFVHALFDFLILGDRLVELAHASGPYEDATKPTPMLTPEGDRR